MINGGSSSLKFSLYEGETLVQKWSGVISPIGSNTGNLEITNDQHEVIEHRSGAFKDLKVAVSEMIRWLKDKNMAPTISAIGHRLVQGGPEHRQPELVTDELLKTLGQFIYLAPNHLPDELMAIKAFQAAFPKVPQVACFDTAFHQDIPSYAKYYALPEKYKAMGLMKYGFHGLSYQYILHELIAKDPDVIKKKIIIAHLGSGASMAAIKNGVSVDTTMGISPVGGLVMATRSGDLDPGVLLFLLKLGNLTAKQLDELLSKNSGLKAIAGISDIQGLLLAESKNLKAAEALTVFCYAAKKFIGALATAMGGLDLLVFTGGIGENSAIIRERICSGLEFMGIDLSEAKSRVAVRVIPTNEAFMIARLTAELLNDKIKP